MRVIVRPSALEEITSAVAWYEEQQPGVGAMLREHFIDTLRRIERFPKSCPIARRNFRRALVRKFPYAIFFAIECDAVIVLSVLHTLDNPKKWPTVD